MESSEFLERNYTGAAIGEIVGGTATVAAAAAGVVYTGVVLAPTAAAAEAAGVEIVAAGGFGAAAYKAGQLAGRQTAKMAIKNGIKVVWEVGRFGGAYTFAGTEAAGRWVGEKLSEL